MRSDVRINGINFLSSQNFCSVNIQTKENTFNVFVDLDTGEITNYEKVKDFIDKTEIYYAIRLYSQELHNKVKTLIVNQETRTPLFVIKLLRKQIGNKSFEKLIKRLG